MTSKTIKGAISGSTWQALKNTIVEVINDDILPATIAAARQDIAAAIEDQYLGIPGNSRTTYTGRTPDQCVMDALTDTGWRFAGQPEFAALAQRFAEHGVSDDFRAGIRFAAQLIADPNFEF